MKTKKHQVFLQLGSNMGDRVYYLNQAKRYIADEIGRLLVNQEFMNLLLGELIIKNII